MSITKPQRDPSKNKIGNGLDRNVLKTILPSFFEEIITEFLKLKEAFAKEDLPHFRVIGHKMRGAAKSFGFYELNAQLELIRLKQEESSINHLKDALEHLAFLIKKAKKETEKEFDIQLSEK